MLDLAPMQREVLAAIRRRHDRGDPSPTYRDLCVEFGWSSTGTARDHLQALARKGVLQLSGGRARLLRLHEEAQPIGRIPLLGQIVAGKPLPAEELQGEHYPVPLSWVRGGTYFALRVKGDSMRDAGILAEDLVVVRKQTVATDGDVVAATVDGETTLKTFRWRDGLPFLCPENPAYIPIEIRDENTMIHGVVVGVMRHLRDTQVRRVNRRGESAAIMKGSAPK